MRFFLNIRRALNAFLSNMAVVARKKVTVDCKRFDVDPGNPSVHSHFEGQALPAVRHGFSSSRFGSNAI
jgi:hypothetical protein